jgi:hypothetical protein
MFPKLLLRALGKPFIFQAKCRSGVAVLNMASLNVPMILWTSDDAEKLSN